MICKPCACDADWQSPNMPLYIGCESDDCEGHDSCKGCTCQHKPVKAGQIVSS